MPPETAEELAAEKSFEDKLGAFYEAEMADTAQVAPAAEETPESEPEPDGGPARNEKGQFVAKDEPATEEPAEEPAEEPVEELLAGKYKSPAELEAAYRALESRLGSQGQELGEMRKQLEEAFDQRLTQFQQQQAQQQYATAAPGTVQSLLDNGRYQDAAAAALQSGNQGLYYEVMNQWTSEEPYPAYAFDNQLRQQALLQAVDQRLQSVNELTEPLVAHTAQQEFSEAMVQFMSDKPDMQRVAPEMLKIADEKQQFLRPLFEMNTAESRGEILDYLYTKAKGRASDTLTAAQQQAAEETQAADRQAKTQAAVGSTAAKADPKPKTEQDKWRDEFRKVLFDDSTSIRSGLTFDE